MPGGAEENGEVLILTGVILVFIPHKWTEEAIPTIQFKTKPFKIGSWTIIRLPKSESSKLPSRGQAMVEGTINDYNFRTPLEPDGELSHWFRVDEKLEKVTGVREGKEVTLQLQVMNTWPEPVVPEDIQQGLANHKKANDLWIHITPMARWEWIRWIRSTGNPQTRQRRIEVACSKLESGKRRPCCWNRNLCTEPSISKNGVLLKIT